MIKIRYKQIKKLKKKIKMQTNEIHNMICIIMSG